MAVQMHQLAGVMEYVVFGVAAGLGIFFLAQVRRKRGDWDVLFAMTTLAAFSLMQRLWGPSGPVDISSPTFGRRFPWLRYGQWFLTFPALLVAAANLTGMRGGRWGRTMATLGAFQVALFLGVTAAYSTSTASKIVLACISAAAYALVLVLTAFTSRVTSREVPRSLRGFVRLLRYLLLLTWLAYPVLWAIGPEGFDQISFDGETVAFAFADVFAKCAWSLLLWYFRRTIRKSVPAQFWTAQAGVQIPPGSPGNSGTGIAQQLLLKDSPELPTGRRFQPAIAEDTDAIIAPGQKAPLLLEEPPEIPLSGWPLGLARARAVVAPPTRPREVPKLWFPGLSDQIRIEQAAASPAGTPFPVTQALSISHTSPRQELQTGEGVVLYQNPLASAETGEEEAEDSRAVSPTRDLRGAQGEGRSARARIAELRIDIPTDVREEGSEFVEVGAAEWGGVLSAEERKRTWASFIFGRGKPTEIESPNEETGFRRPSGFSLYERGPKGPGKDSPVSVIVVDEEAQLTPAPPRKVRRISKGSGADSPAKTTPVVTIISDETPPTTPGEERKTPRAPPRRRPLPSVIPEGDPEEQGTPPKEEGAVRDVPGGSPELSKKRRQRSVADSDVDSFDSVGSGLDDSSGSDGGVPLPQFRVPSVRELASKPEVGSPPVSDNPKPFVGGSKTSPRELIYQSLAEPEIVEEGGSSKASSKASPLSPSLRGFDEGGVIWARPARRQRSGNNLWLRRLPALEGSEASEFSAPSFPGELQDRFGSPVRRTGLTRSASAGDLVGGEVSVSFEGPRRRPGGLFPYWSAERRPGELDVRSSESERETSWGSPTSTLPTPLSTDAELSARSPDIPPRILSRTQAGGLSTARGFEADVSSLRDSIFGAVDDGHSRRGPRGTARWEEELPVALWRRSYDTSLARRTPERGTEFRLRPDRTEFRRRSFPIPRSRAQRKAAERSFLTERRGLEGFEDPLRTYAKEGGGYERRTERRGGGGRSGHLSEPTAEAWEERFRSQDQGERNVSGSGTVLEREAPELRRAPETDGTGTEELEQRIVGVGFDDPGVVSGRRAWRVHPYYHYTGSPVDLPPVSRRGGLEPIQENRSPERMMSPEGPDRLQTAVRFYSPDFRRT